MAGIPIIYRKAGETAVASYNYTDIAEGTGVVVFYGFKTYDGNYHLSNNVLYSETIETISATNMTFNFDLSPFNLPKIIKGTALVKFCFRIIAAGTISFVLTLQKVSGGAATSIGTASLSNYSVTTAPVNRLVSIALTETHFKAGDFLRFVMDVTNNGGSTAYGHDPANREGVYVTPVATYPTKLEVHIPFKLDL